MGVLVLGMHRSGTSAVARVVNLLGFHLGDESAFVRPSPANPTGHWEIEALSHFNAELLVELGGTGSAPPATSPDDLVALAHGEWGTRAKELIDQSFAGRPWVWKDPRLCLLLPFWRHVLDESPIVVAPVRNPLEVADSLQARSGLPTGYSLALWERYVRRGALDADGLASFVVDYHALVAEPARVRHELDSFFTDLQVEREPAAEAPAVDAFVDPALHRQRRDPDDLAALGTDGQVSLWRHVRARAGRRADDLARDLPDESPGLQLAFDEHHRLSVVCREEAESKAVVLDYLEDVIAERDRLRQIVNRIKGFLPIRAALALRTRITGNAEP
jgi:hypothetical protein